MLAVDWSTTQLAELDLTSTDLTERTLMDFFAMVPKLTYLAVPFCDGFTDKVSQSSTKFFFLPISKTK